MYAKILICISLLLMSFITNGQRAIVYNRNEVPGGWVVTEMTCNNLNCIYTIEKINTWPTGSVITIVPINNNILGGWQVIARSGTNLSNLKLTIQKTAGMNKGTRISVCNLDNLGGEWKLISSEPCNNCALTGILNETCFVIEKTTEGKSENRSQNNNNNSPNSNSGNNNNSTTDKQPPPNVGITFGTPTNTPKGNRTANEPIKKNIVFEQEQAIRNSNSSRLSNRGGGPEKFLVTYGGGPIASQSFSHTFGTVCFYTKQNEKTNIRVMINENYMGRIVSYFTGNYIPYCQEDGTLTVQIPQGSYTYRAETYNAQRQKKEWTGTFTVTNKNCTLIQIMDF
jgi:hypothetical protein